ncbi:hypothetical protein JR316_0005886 [Psilocybe cubensis]|uniref:Uncharacterized protein n=2 Tax=Psilocybe cubensis TaxID=181762 RepID=A0ACB8H1K1_PSICU|nr:hypothetical protein JR316_0005886 [Psilocybe cubensis]KAH9481361.1 hypothetical protein JR316_0005886 [Psilocybe cubensis]
MDSTTYVVHLSPSILLYIVSSVLIMFVWYYNRSAFSVLPIMGYALLAIVLAYLSIRGYRYLKSRAQTSVSLPKPVSGSSHKSTYALGRSTGWNWRRWILPRVPSWPKVPEVVVGKAKAVAHSKNLSVELLPTTGLPPPPTASPTPIAAVTMPTPQLVDLTTPATPPLTTGTTFNSYPTSPRTPSPPYMPHISTSKLIYPTPPHASYPRPPSPHGIFATTIQKPHRRSRSLGGVPVRRLSGGTSGLRNAIELKELSGDHKRGTSREHLLIDFNSSSSSDDDRESIMKISPAASDIGILPPGKGLMPLVDPRMVGRHVPLVDLGDDNHFSSQVEHEDDSWRWFNPSGVTTPLADRIGTSILRPKSSLATLRVEKLVDVDSESDSEPVLGSNPIGIHRVEVQTTQIEKLIDIHPPKEEVKVKEATLVDVDDYTSVADGTQNQGQLVDVESLGNTLEPIHSSPPPFPIQTSILMKATLPLPQETLTLAESPFANPLARAQSPTVENQDQISVVSKNPGLLVEHANEEHELYHSESKTSSPLSEFNYISESTSKGAEAEDLESGILSHDGWEWDLPGHSDPWASHIAETPSPSSEVFVYTGLDAVEREGHEPDVLTLDTSLPSAGSDLESEGFKYDAEVLEKSPGASLLPTELTEEDEEEMPSLTLSDDLENPTPDHVDFNLSEHILLDEEQDLTPKPTPSSLELALPAMPAEGVMLSEDYPDPELLPLPESPLLLTIDIPDPETPSLAFEKDEPVERAMPCQTPTPPASPPPISPLRFVNSSNGSNVFHLSPHATTQSMSHLQLPSSPRLSVSTGRSPRTSSSPSLHDIEEKENATPTALSPKNPKSIVAQDVHVTLASKGGNTQESPVLHRRILGDHIADEVESKQSEPATDDVVVHNEMTPESYSLPETDIAKAVQHVLAVKLSSNFDETPLPGSFPDSKPFVEVSTPISKPDTSATSTTIGARLAMTSNSLTPRPSARALVRSPVDIALAMQLRPGLGAGADPAWMVRFLMAMFGWLAVVVSGQVEY